MKRLPGKAVMNTAVSPLLDFIADQRLVKERYEALPHAEKSKHLAYASAVWGIAKTAELVGLTERRVWQARESCAHMVQELRRVAVEATAQVYLNKALEIAVTIDPNQISQDKKAQAVKAMMDACDIARLQGIKTNGETEAEETVELFYRVRRRLKKAEDEGDDDGEDKDPAGGVIDITGEVEEVKDEEGAGIQKV